MFGCRSFVHVENHKRETKFSPRSLDGALSGYDIDIKFKRSIHISLYIADDELDVVQGCDRCEIDEDRDDKDTYKILPPDVTDNRDIETTKSTGPEVLDNFT